MKVSRIVVMTLTICTLLIMPAFADSYVSETKNANGFSKTTNDSSVTFTFKPVANMYNIGFSTSPVRSMDEEPVKASQDGHGLTVLPGNLTGELVDELYVYWQISSSISCKVTLTPSVMECKDANGTVLDTLNIDFYTTNVGSTTGEEYETTKISSAEGESKIILNYDSSTVENKESVGCQKISIATESLIGKVPGRYEGTISVAIKTTN